MRFAMLSPAPETSRSPLKRLAQWWRDVTAAPLATEVGGEEAARIAADVGLTVPELDSVRHMGTEAAYPMYRRLSSLGLDEAELARSEPGVLHDLQRVCSFCVDKSQCMHELKSDPNDTTWQTYCPNMPTLEALEAERDENKG
jgi:hypothetical protein